MSESKGAQVIDLMDALKKSLAEKARPKTCPHCGAAYHPWMECPRVQRREVPSSYGWKFGQGQNPARREKFFKDAAADPFGVTSE